HKLFDGRELTLPMTPPSSSASRAAASQSSSFLERWPFGIIQRRLPRVVTSISLTVFLAAHGQRTNSFLLSPWLFRLWIKAPTVHLAARSAGVVAIRLAEEI